MEPIEKLNRMRAADRAAERALRAWQRAAARLPEAAEYHTALAEADRLAAEVSAALRAGLGPGPWEVSVNLNETQQADKVPTL